MQRIVIENPVHLHFKSQPIRQGVPWPQGYVQPGSPLTARDENGAALPLGVRTLNCWPDGSVQWSLLDFAIDLEPSGKRTIMVDAEPDDASELEASALLNAVSVATDEQGLTVANGLTEIRISSRPGVLIESWQANLGRVVEDNGFDVVLQNADGNVFSAARCSTKKVSVEDANPLRAVIRIEGRHEAEDGSTLLDFWLRFTVTANRADVKVTYHYRNKENQEPGIVLRSMAMRLQTALPPTTERAIVHSCRTRDFRTEPYRLHEDFEIVASNTPHLATYPETHRGLTGGGLGRVFIRQPELLRDGAYKPWFLRDVADFKFGNVFPPEWGIWSYLGLVSDEGSLLCLGANMAGLHPKSLSITGNVVQYSIWPEWAGPMDITQGEGRTLAFFVGPLPPNASDDQLMNQYFSWEFGNIYAHHGIRPPVKVSLDTGHVRQCGVFAIDKLPAYDPRDNFAFERKVKNEWTP
ncbi:MAG TPA: hypothetical protein VNA16_02030, partial [Abditibacteriaceae bacterium]|nr:hypothetical protein [Abditibacteriaceae bacterium]